MRNEISTSEVKDKFKVLLLAAFLGAVFIVSPAKALEPWVDVSDATMTSSTYEIFNMVSYNGNLYAAGNDGNNSKVWQYDGSTWTQINTDGFGDANNYDVHSLEIFDGNLYAGAQNWVTGAEVWKYDGTTWSQVNTDGFGFTWMAEVNSLEVYDGNLYAGVYDNEDSAQLYRYDGGTTWTAIGTAGFGDSSNSHIRSLESHDGKLYIGTQNTFAGAEVWTWDGSSTVHITEGKNGFIGGENSNHEIYSMQSYDGNLYAAVGDSNVDAAIYRYDGGVTWTQINTNGFGDINNDGIRNMLSYDGKLYANVYYNGNGTELWEYDGSTWTQVNTNGFGQGAGETYGGALAEHDGYIYASSAEPGEGPWNAKVWKSQADLDLLDAVDLIGQTDENGDPVWTARNTNNNISPNSIGLSNPMKTSLDPINHRLFVADSGNNRVLVFNLDALNNPLDYEADYVLGQSDFSTNTSATTQSGMNSPRDAEYDSNNERLFVSDQYNNRVLIYDLSGGITNGMNASYVWGQEDFASSISATTQNGMRYPNGIEYDTISNVLFVAEESNNRVVRYDATIGEISNGQSANLVLGQSLYTTNTQVTTQNGMNNPRDVAYDAINSRLFVVDNNSSRVLIYSLSGEYGNGENASNVLGQADFVSSVQVVTQSGMNYPRSISYDENNGRLVVADSGNSRILVYDLSGEYGNGENAAYVLGETDFVSSNYVTSQSGLNGPFGVNYDPDNDKLFVSDSYSRIVIYDLSEGITNGMDASDLLGKYKNESLIWNNSSSNNGGPGPNGFDIDTSYAANALAMDPINHRFFVADIYNNRVLVFNLDENNELIDRIADNVLGQVDFYSSSSGPDTASSLARPRSVSYDSDRNWLFVGDERNDRVLVYDVATIDNGEAAIYVLGQKEFTEEPEIGDTAVDPYGMIYDQKNQRLFVESGNVSIEVFDVSSITNGEASINHLGTPGVMGTDLNQIGSWDEHFMYYDSTEDRLFVSDELNRRVLVFDVSTIVDEEDAVNVIGTGVREAAQNAFSEPKGVFHDVETGTLFVTDMGTNSVRLFDISNGIIDEMDAYNVIGQSNFTTSIRDTTRERFNDLHGIHYDTTANKLYTLGERSNRVMIFQLPNVTTAPVSGKVGVAYSKTLSSEGGRGPYTYSLGAGSLPSGLTLSESGVISGTPTENGTFTFTVIVEDSYTIVPGSTAGLKGGTELSITIGAAAGATVDIDRPSVSEIEIKIDGEDEELKKWKTFYSQEEKPKFKGTNSEVAGGTIKVYRRNKNGGKSLIEEISVDENGNWSGKVSLEDGTNYIYFRAVDADGNESDLSSKIKVKVDTHDPEFTEFPTEVTVTKGQKINFLAIDNETSVDYYKVQLLGSREPRKQDEPYYIIPEDVPYGTYSLEVKAYDKAGNKERIYITVNYVAGGGTQVVATEKEEVQETQEPEVQGVSTREAEKSIQEIVIPKTTLDPIDPPAPVEEESGFKWWNPFTWF